MPQLTTPIHIEMFERGRRARSLSTRLKKALKVLLSKDLYGLEWGDPETDGALRYVRDHFLLPYLPKSTVVEIGPGGGRWTRYMGAARQVYAVDYHQELLSELAKRFARSNVVFVRNNGDDFPGIPDGSVDLVFSFGVFVHLDLNIIAGYLKNIRPLLKQTSNIVIQYSDQTKALARSNPGFSDNDPERMRSLVLSHGYEILEEDVGTMCHSSIIRFGL